MVQTMHVYCYHGCCIARSNALAIWYEAAKDESMSLLHWNSLVLTHGYTLLGPRLSGTEYQIFQHLAMQGPATAEDIAKDANIFSQRPNLALPHVQIEYLKGRLQPGPSPTDRDTAIRTQTHLQQQRIIFADGQGRYFVVRPDQMIRRMKMRPSSKTQ